jgi:hypothetical protein
VQVDVGIGVHEEAGILQESAALTLHKCNKADLAGFVFSGLNVEGATL